MVVNSDFEGYEVCPSGIGTGYLECSPWQNGNCATCDYYNSCAAGMDAGVPDNWAGSQTPHSGNGYMGFICKWGTPDWQEFPQIRLKEPCVAGYSYEIEFYVSLSGLYCGIEHIGAHFSKEPPPDSSYCGPLAVVPQFVSNQGFLSDTTEWMLVRGCFIAQGGEQWMTIGNFNHQDDTELDPSCNTSPLSYYYIDDVSLTISEEAFMIDFDLGDPVTICDEYLIDPGLDNVEYAWSDGSRDETLLVTESGTYALTITEPGCKGYGVDSIEITILGVPDPIDIGPQDTVICEGESYEIELDPDIGTYEWQDGSTDTEYTITTTGLYQVTLDDGCDESMDEVMVTVLPPPAPFTLGPDEILCPEEILHFQFDTSLGDFLWQDGSPKPNYAITGEGSYSLTISNMCGAVTDEIEIVELETPALDLEDQPLILCEDASITIEVDPDQGTYIWQDGSNTTEYNVESPGTYFVTVTNECGVAEDSVAVMLVLEPILEIGDDQYLCPSQLPYLINPQVTPDNVEYTWFDGSTEDSIWVENPGVYTLEVSNECFEVQESIEITLEDVVPVVVLPPDQLLCTGETFELTADAQNGTIVWQDSSTSTSYTVNTPGIYYVSVTNFCGTGADTILVEYIDVLSSPSLGPDASLCPGEQIVLTTSVTDVNYLWQDGSTNDTLIVTTAGTYTLQISDTCSMAIDTIIIVENNVPPQVNLPASLSVCQGDTVTIEAGVSGVSYLWNDGSIQSAIIVNAPGTYSITVSNACGSDADTVLVVVNGTIPTVTLGDDIGLCPGENVTITPNSSNVSNWIWQDGSTQPTIIASDAGAYAVTVSNGCGSSQDTILVEHLPVTPPFDLGVDTALCPGFSYELTIQVPDVDITWFDGSSSSFMTIQSPGEITAEITNGCGVSYDTIVISTLPAAPVLHLGADQSLCLGETITINPGLQGVMYQWQDGSVAPMYQSIQEETIILIVSNACGSDTDTLEIIESTEGPQVNLGADIIGCAGDTVTLMSNISGVDFEWNDGSDESQLVVWQTGNYILAVSNLCGQDTDTISVDLSNQLPSVFLGADTLVCEGSVLLLTAETSNATEITWNDGSHLAQINVTEEGLYFVNAWNFCGERADTIFVAHEFPPASFSLGPDTVLCPGDFMELHVPLSGYAIEWQDGSEDETILADEAKTYKLILRNACGSSEDEIEVSIDTQTPVIHFDERYTWCEGDEIVLNAIQLFPVTYLWSDGSSEPSITITTPGTYSVAVSTDCNTTSEQTIVESIEPCDPVEEIYNGIFIPNVFSPNEDGVNDVFVISFGEDIDIMSSNGSVYDRWGSLLYASTEIPFTWDGSCRGERMNPGVYVYSIELKYTVDGRERVEVLKGDVTVMR